MPKMRRKSDLPTKICAVCKRPFAWRRKWVRDRLSVNSVPNGAEATGEELRARKANMLRKDMKTGLSPDRRSRRDRRFEALAEDWWNPDGRMKLVHSFNAARVTHLRNRLPALMVRDARLDRPLDGLTLLDVVAAPAW